MNSQRTWLVGGALVLLVGGIAYWMLNRPYGSTGEQAYAYATALFMACNQQDAAKLQQVSAMIESDTEQGRLSQQESKWLMEVIACGLDGDWETANRQVRQLMEAQIDHSK